jgi:SpoVK/Ycf46/Vps4 family AAA+-type ATPase
MLWVKIEDIKLKELYKKKGYCFVFNKEDIYKAISLKKDIVSFLKPADFGFENYGFFNLIEDKTIPDEIKDNNLLDKYLEEKLHLKAIKPQTTFSDLAGAEKLKEDVRFFNFLEKYNTAIGGLFLFGVPGAGKSYFAECFAGETKRMLIDLDLTKISYDENPSESLNKIIEFLLEKKGRYVLWIDEIEKMIDPSNPKAMQVFGRLLTVLNDINKYNIKELVFIVTANKITNIMENNPEFLRKGRFRKLYFLNFPSFKSAKAIFQLYINKNLKKIEKLISLDRKLKIKSIFNKLNLDEELKYIDNLFYENKIENTFIYSPAEIKTFVDEMFFKILFNLENNIPVNTENIIKEIITEVIPIQASMKEGIYSMVSQKRSFGRIEFKMFEEVS